MNMCTVRFNILEIQQKNMNRRKKGIKDMNMCTVRFNILDIQQKMNRESCTILAK